MRDSVANCFDPQHWHVVVHRAVRILTKHDVITLVNAAIHRESRAPNTVFDYSGLAIGQRCFNNLK